MENRKIKCAEDSYTNMVEAVLPNDTNNLGNVLGGRVMHWIDIAGSIAARRHSGYDVVTASMDILTFDHPIRRGSIAILEATVVYVGKTSMDIEVKVYSEGYSTSERKRTSTAYLTFVALDNGGTPVEVPMLDLCTEEQKQKFKEAGKRRKIRKKMKKVSKS